MSVKRFKFVSPGIFLNEIDNSRLPRPPSAVGPTVIGRLEKGPGLIPLTIQSMAQFVEIFGQPQPGGVGGDVWRDGNQTAPTYAAYAAQAYLQNSGPVNVVRLLGVEDSNATTAGAAGWSLSNTIGDNPAGESSVYGLYLFSQNGIDSRQTHKTQAGLTGIGRARVTGTLAALWYFEKGAITLSGSIPFGIGHQPASIGVGAGGSGAAGHTSGSITGSCALVRTIDESKMEFAAYLYQNSRTKYEKVVFNFDPDSDKYIRKVFNTNPTLTNSTITQAGGLKHYWLGESFDRHVRDNHGLSDSTNKLLHRGALSADSTLSAMVVPLTAQANSLNRNLEQQNSTTGWFFSQDILTSREAGNFQAESMQKLFRFHGISDGGWNSANIKISISNLKVGNDVDPYGTFTVLVRKVSDKDGRMHVLERFSQCSLNPNSSNYIGRKIGDQYREWDEADKRYRVYGDFDNQSSFLRVEVDQDVDAGVTEPLLLPFGFYGPPRYKTGKIVTGVKRMSNRSSFASDVESATFIDSLCEDSLISFNATGSDVHLKAYRPYGMAPDIAKTLTGSAWPLFGFGTAMTASLIYPTLPMRLSASEDGLADPKSAFFGASTSKAPDNPRFDKSWIDVTRRLPQAFMGTGVNTADNQSNVEHSFLFTCDDLILVHKTASINSAGGSCGDISASLAGNAIYVSGSRRAGKSSTAALESYKELVKSGFANFTSPMYGGFDGLDVREKEPFNNTVLSGKDESTSYAQASLKRAIDAVADPEVIEMNALCAPGVTDKTVTDRIIRVAEDRADSLAIIDIEKGGYIPDTETTDTFKRRIQNSKVDTCVPLLEARGINSSYACTFFPWVKIQDDITDRQLWVPPSVVALGTFAYTEANAELWFAPAGFTRGGLSDGAGGVPVLGVSQRLSTKERDELYENNINPIAKFPAEGIVVFGQKTLQVTRSALDRINVRRLMIYVKKEVSRMAATLLFDNNVQATWDRFRGKVEPFLDSVKSRFGLTEFKVILDETTTTPDLIDRNIMYAKIFLKPARAIEYIAIDFVITNSGASFED